EAAGVADRRDEVRAGQVRSHRRGDDGVLDPQYVTEIRFHEHLKVTEVNRSEPATTPGRGTPGCPPVAAAAAAHRNATGASVASAAPANPPVRAGPASCPGRGAAPRRTPGGGYPPGRQGTGRAQGTPPGRGSPPPARGTATHPCGSSDRAASGPRGRSAAGAARSRRTVGPPPPPIAPDLVRRAAGATARGCSAGPGRCCRAGPSW